MHETTIDSLNNNQEYDIIINNIQLHSGTIFWNNKTHKISSLFIQAPFRVRVTFFED